MRIKRVIATGVITVMLVTAASLYPSHAEEGNDGGTLISEEIQGDAVVNNKSEVVYAALTSEGAVKAVYVVNHFELGKGGGLTDYGNYIFVQNLTEHRPLEQKGDTVFTQTAAENFYYQGNLADTELPWTFEITYDLNGVNLSSQGLAGKSGELGIDIKTNRNGKVTPEFYENYMLQITLALDSEKCGNIIAPGATIAEAGNSKMLAFTVLPDTDADYRVTADVYDFSMKGIEISAMPFTMSFNLPDIDGILKGFEQLPEAVSQLEDGVGMLAEGAAGLKQGADELAGGSKEFKNGLSELKRNSSQITGASAQINTALSEIAASLSSGFSGAVPGNLEQLPDVLSQLSDGLKGISGGITELRDGYLAAYTALDHAVQGIPDTAITQEQINSAFAKVNKDQQVLLEQLYTSYLAGQAVKETYNQVRQVFDSIIPAIDKVSSNIDIISGSLEEISDNIGDSLSSPDMAERLGQLTQGLAELSSNYSAFDKGLMEYMNGVGTLSEGYNQFDLGLSEFGNGVGELEGGTLELYNGIKSLNEEISRSPERIQEEADKLMEEYTGSDFEQISFVSPKNQKIGLVQFVIKCEDIKLPQITEMDTEEEVKKEETVLDRLIALFK